MVETKKRPLLRRKILAEYGSIGAFAVAAGKTRQWVSTRLNSDSGFSKATMVQWCELLNIPFSESGNYFF